MKIIAAYRAKIGVNTVNSNWGSIRAISLDS